jgi:glycosyltransferase involved in cell wall biosynthesis
MSGPVQLSIILTTHTEKVHFESLLLTLLRVTHPGIELIVINDAAETETAEQIHRSLKEASGDQVYLFEHEKKIGRGACLNEGLVQATGVLVWTPLRAERLSIPLMVDFIRRFKSDPTAFWTLDYSLPEVYKSWLTSAEDGNLPDDSCLVWNRNIIHSERFFFNPFLSELHGAELALRLYKDHAWHQTDPFFVVSDHQSIFADQKDTREILHTMLRLDLKSEERKHLLSRLTKPVTNGDGHEGEDQLLVEARQYLTIGDANRSLELISKYLRKYPGHHEANLIKITSLEKLRRHVEAAEFKHQIQKQKAEQRIEPKTEPEKLPEPPPEPLFMDKIDEKEDVLETAAEPEIFLSVVMPTTGAGKPLLESALIRLEEVADEKTTELIVIDNASIDDTFDYLEQLRANGFLNLQIITNKVNMGFGASVNQGLNRAKGNYILVLHNDTLLEDGSIQALMEAFDKQDGVILTAPVLDHVIDPGQQKMDDNTTKYVEIRNAESCCFMVPKSLKLRFDENFRMCHFEMEDFCRQIEEEGGKMLAVTNANAIHHEGSTLQMMGIQMVPELKWANRDRYHKKWASAPQYRLPKQGSHPDRFIKLGAPDDPMNPDPEWVDVVQNYLSDEVRTEILRTKWDEEDLITIVSTLLIADERELLRTLEDRLNNLELTPALIILFVQYYFNKNIYSRCMHYLEKAGKAHPVFDLYRLKILVADKEAEKATPLLTKMLDKYPASPDLLHLAGDLYRQNGEKDEAKSFYTLASQLDPFRFTFEESFFELNH